MSEEQKKTKGRGNRRVIRYRNGSLWMVLDPAIAASAGISDGDIVEQISQSPGQVLLRRTGERRE